MRVLLICLVIFYSLVSAAQAGFTGGETYSAKPENPVYEFRGVWIATVDNIDWPQRGMVTPYSQKAEFIRQLEMHKKNGMNAIIMQIRPAADAFYPSPFEPWSQWLTGIQGRPPSPYYDPLQFMIEETHKRGMEFHAWLNPYRANFNVKSASIARNHITRTHPEWFVTYGTTKYFDPGNKQAQEFVVKVVRDIVKRYDIDAVHMDDYFYPYRIAGKEFPDAKSYKNSGTSLSKDDWRRSNVDSIIRKLSIAIKQENPLCKFGISPFSVWRNKSQDPEGSDSQAGQTNYDDLYADILLWLEEQWIDYVAPQLYLEIGHDRVAYEKLLDWWSKHSYGRHIYIGHGIYRSGERRSYAWKNPEELPNQIKLLREYPNVQGSIYFSSKTFDSNPNGWNDSLRNNYYRTPALIPPMDWLEADAPPKPDSLSIRFSNGNNAGTAYTLATYSKKGMTAVEAMMVYISTKKEDLLKKSQAALKFTVEEKKTSDAVVFYGFYPGMHCQNAKKYYVASSFKNKNGEESEISNIITVTRQKNGSFEFNSEF
jgi:uncharacterized lipoprotein YddW (UPF0748 family)